MYIGDRDGINFKHVRQAVVTGALSGTEGGYKSALKAIRIRHCG